MITRKRRPSGLRSMLPALLLVAALSPACTNVATPAPQQPDTQPTSVLPSVAPTGEVAVVEPSDCPLIEPQHATAQPYLAAPATPPGGPGAGQGEEDGFNEEVEPTTDINPDAVIQDDADLAPSIIAPPGAQDPPAPTDIVVYSLPQTVAGTDQIAEPNVAAHGPSRLMTWNLGTARSFDGGQTMSFLDPWKAMQGPLGLAVDGGFCCDQLAHYVPEYDLWIWVLQSRTLLSEHHGGNRIRVFLATGVGPFDRYLDFKSNDFDLGTEFWFDQPKIGSSDGHLFLSMNAFGPNPPSQPGEPLKPEPFIAAVVYRLPLAALDEDQQVQPACMTTSNQLRPSGRPLFAVVPVREAGPVMFLGAHHDNSTLAIWRWPDDSTEPTFHLAHNRAPDGTPRGYPVPIVRDAQGNPVRDADGYLIADDFRCLPAGVTDARTNWCERSSDRIASAWMAGGRIGFSWNVGQDPVNGWPFPSVWVWILDEALIPTCESGGCLVDNPNIRNRNFAFQHAGISPNSRGDLGATFLYGGGAYRMGCALAVRDSLTQADQPWDVASLKGSDRDPPYPVAGDYQNAWPGPTDGTWTGGCMTVQSANQLPYPGSVHFAHFGRRSDDPTP